MGRTAEILLVIWVTIWRGGLLSLSLLIVAAAPLNDAVRLENYQEFWVWGGIHAAHIPQQAQRLYLLQGSIRLNSQNQPIFQRQGILPQALNAPIFLVYRLETLAWNTIVQQSILNQIKLWQAYQQPVLGIQLDFDAGTKNLQNYEQFLRKVRAEFPQQYQLSITGLLDWSQNAKPEVLQSLADILDEVIFQTYQGKKTIPHYASYIHSLLRLQVPFKVGVVEQADWNVAYEGLLKKSPYFRGMVVFLLPVK
ncbi:MAG: hypothetical protein RL368_1928 [Pseudomonadota bacterium]|jgi:hypothetical protein